MKRLVVFFCAVALGRAQFSQGQYNPYQFNSGFGTNSQFSSFPARNTFGAGNGFDLFSSNSLNNNNFFRQQQLQTPQNGFQTASQNAFSTFSGFPFSAGSYNQPAQNQAQSSNSFFPSTANFNYQQPQQQQQQQFTFPQQSYQPNQFSVPQAPQPAYQPSYQAPAPQTNYQAPPPPPPQQPAYQPPVQQQAYQAPPQVPYQQPAYTQPTAPRAAPYINTAQLSYNAAAPPQPQNSGASSPQSGTTPTDKPSVYHPPAPVHYVSIGQKLEGDYKFGYETGKGSNGDESFRSETRDADGTVRGSYGYVDSNGKQITVHYEAGREGFKILSEDEAKNGKRPAPAQQQAPQAPVQQPQNRPQPVAQSTPENAAPAPAASDESVQSSGQRRRKRRPNQA